MKELRNFGAGTLVLYNEAPLYGTILTGLKPLLLKRASSFTVSERGTRKIIFEQNKKKKDKETLIDEVRRMLRASLGHRAKESLIVDFINETDLDSIDDKAGIIDAFFTFAQEKQRQEAEALIEEEQLNKEAAKRYILRSLKHQYTSENGTELNEILPIMSPLNPQYLTKKQSVFEK